MTIAINPDQERRIQELVRSGRLHSVGDLLDHALEAFAPHDVPMADAQENRRRRAKAAAVRIRALRKGLSLEGLKIKDLIEGECESSWVRKRGRPPSGGWKSSNALLKAKRQGRLSAQRAEEFLGQLRGFAIEFDNECLAKADSEIAAKAKAV